MDKARVETVRPESNEAPYSVHLGIVPSGMSPSRLTMSPKEAEVLAITLQLAAAKARERIHYVGYMESE